ncbi:hypothetical protein P691DRAFT_325045 [Macrolepiota fuliginosa MF-IS2]|uniref:Uncharacterized protein n=1 Tax=Macrolepiota fuliginosa MF-IS2 TaxID=1400762 RepID=A0A9P6BYU7_9AGAR|nr:hypothetical protein P691DRAFT_325045 [Macrolepiota fuliginosa MF-IS2]
MEDLYPKDSPVASRHMQDRSLTSELSFLDFRTERRKFLTSFFNLNLLSTAIEGRCCIRRPNDMYNEYQSFYWCLVAPFVAIAATLLLPQRVEKSMRIARP